MIPVRLSRIARMLDSPLGSNGTIATDIAVKRIETDSRKVQHGDLFFALSGARFDGHDFVEQAVAHGAAACVVRDDAHARFRHLHQLLAVESVEESLMRLATEYRREVLPATTRVIAVTGSNGKTTTKNLIHHVLSRDFQGTCAEKSFNNHIGVPLTILAADETDEFVVAEIGTNAPGEIAKLAQIVSPDVAVITGVAEAHLEGLGCVQSVAAEKASILPHVRPGGVAFLCGDYAELRPYQQSATQQVRTFGLAQDCDYSVRIVEATLHHTQAVINELWPIQVPLPGTCHAVNAAAALAVARWMGMDAADVGERLRSTPATSGRAQVVTAGDVTIVDDSYNANPGSLRAAIETLSSIATTRRVLVMGDMLELGRFADELHDDVLQRAVTSGVDLIIGVGGRTSAAIRRRLCSDTMQHIAAFPDARSCLETLPALLRSGDLVWCKGSRRMALETVVEGIATLQAAHPAGAARAEQRSLVA